MQMLPPATLIQPHWHTALIHFPIALLTLGAVLEVFSGVLRATGAREAARWMILLGAILAAPAAVSGLHALADLARPDAAVHWYQADRLPEAVFAELSRHALLQSAATLVALGVVATYLALSDGLRRFLYPPLLLMLLLAVGGSALASHEVSQTVRQKDYPAIAVVPTSLPSDWEGRAVYVAPPLKLHTLLGSLAVSVGTIALALALRNAAIARGAEAPVKSSGREMHPGTGRADQPRSRPVAYLPASRVLLLTAVLGIVSAAAGWWHLSREAQTTVPRELWETVVTFPPSDVLKPEYRDLLRRPAHVLMGSVLVAVPVLLSLTTLLRPRHRLLTLLLGAVFVATAAGQVWVGTLLLWDQPIGPLDSFVRPESSQTR
jgi:hypothetical protein